MFVKCDFKLHLMLGHCLQDPAIQLSILHIDNPSCQHDYLQQVSLLLSWEGEAMDCWQIYRSSAAQVTSSLLLSPALCVPVYHCITHGYHVNRAKIFVVFKKYEFRPMSARDINNTATHSTSCSMVFSHRM